MANLPEEIVQRSEAWFAARRGKVTASRVADILATIRNGNWAAARKNYAAQLVTERLTGKDPEPFMNEAMQWGIDQEEPARNAYSKTIEESVEEIGFIDHPRILHSGASPDGIVGGFGLVELKCPNTATHIETLLGSDINERHRLQMMWQLACTEREWCDYVSYDPRLPDDMQLFIKRFERNDKEIHHLENEVEIFLHEVAATVAALKEKFGE